MTVVGALTVLLACQLAGEVAVRALGLPVPGPVVGMALLFVGLAVRGRVPATLEAVSGTLLAHLALLFVPAGVGVIAFVPLIATASVPLLLALVPGTLLTVLVTGWMMTRLGGRSPAEDDR